MLTSSNVARHREVNYQCQLMTTNIETPTKPQFVRGYPNNDPYLTVHRSTTDIRPVFVCEHGGFLPESWSLLSCVWCATVESYEPRSPRSCIISGLDGDHTCSSYQRSLTEQAIPHAGCMFLCVRGAETCTEAFSESFNEDLGRLQQRSSKGSQKSEGLIQMPHLSLVCVTAVVSWLDACPRPPLCAGLLTVQVTGIMPPRAVTLASAGKTLTGPPEGYNKKKERTVKKWLTELPLNAEGGDLFAESSIASMPQVLINLDLLSSNLWQYKLSIPTKNTHLLHTYS